MNKLIGISVVIFLTINFQSCEKKSEPKQFPNPRSEMAIAMREMTHKILNTKVSFQSKQVKPFHFESFKNKKFTQDSFDTEWFDPLADLLMEQAATFDKELTIDSYNSVIQTCQSCHEHACPGPLVQIDQLYIEQ